MDVTIPGDARRQRPGIRTHRSGHLPAADVTRFDGVPITTPARTLCDLAALLSVRELNRAAARAEREGLIDADEAAGLSTRRYGRPGAPVLRSALGNDDGLVLTRSEAEERFLALIRKAGLPPLRVNAMVAGYELDFYWPSEGLAVEVDGFAFHSSRGSFEGDRRRDGDLEGAGIHVIRVTWRQVVREPVPTAVRIGRAHARAEAAPRQEARPR